MNQLNQKLMVIENDRLKVMLIMRQIAKKKLSKASLLKYLFTYIQMSQTKCAKICTK